MCGTNIAGPIPFPAKGGEKWFIRGREFTVGTTHQKYFETNGNSETLYLSMRGDDGTCYVITHKAFLDKAKREEPIVERYITPAQILDSNPCNAGVLKLGFTLGVAKYGAGTHCWQVVRAIENNGHMNRKYKVSELYDWFKMSTGAEPENSYLLFLAKALNLVPRDSNGPDRGTLKRLLGIKE